ncbi:hypothetical protein [Virgibacillus doumboii]|uniref:hypothetical protein n=1 Tax=Virgibacillus doumboii TaxID=2697503 RepID=UPI0013DF9AEF|nr:hypothetical protein [Virgibacillus doumboii]
MGAYIFVAASVLALIPIMVLFKMNLEKIRENPDQLEKVQTKFFIGVAISEAIPILLIVFGMVNMTTVDSTSELYIPGLLVIVLMVIAVFFMTLQRAVNTDAESKAAVNSFARIGTPMAMAIPLVSIVGLFMMAP